MVARKALRIASLALLVLAAAPARAGGGKPFQLSLFDPVQLFSRSTPIAGVRLNLFYTNNSAMTGFDWSWLGVARTTGSLKGVQWALGNWVEGTALGWQAGLVNYGGRAATGLQLGFVNLAGRGLGLQWGGVGWSDSHTGVQFNLLFNASKKFTGLQLGLVNYTKRLHGVQIGLVNIAGNGFLPVFPIVNAAF